MEDYFIMAVRRNKEIEDLKARNEYLENKTRIFSSWQNLGRREKTSLSLLWVFSLVLVVLAVTLAFLKVTMASERRQIGRNTLPWLMEDGGKPPKMTT